MENQKKRKCMWIQKINYFRLSSALGVEPRAHACALAKLSCILSPCSIQTEGYLITQAGLKPIHNPPGCCLLGAKIRGAKILGSNIWRLECLQEKNNATLAPAHDCKHKTRRMGLRRVGIGSRLVLQFCWAVSGKGQHTLLKWYRLLFLDPPPRQASRERYI